MESLESKAREVNGSPRIVVGQYTVTVMIRNQLLAETMTRGWKPTDARTRARSGRRWQAILRFLWLFVRSWASVKQFEPTGCRVCPEMLTVTKADPCVYGIRMWVQVWVLDKRLLCVYFTTYSLSEKEGAAADCLLRVWCFCTSRPWGSRFTWEMGLHVSSSGEVPEAWGGG